MITRSHVFPYTLYLIPYTLYLIPYTLIPFFPVIPLGPPSKGERGVWIWGVSCFFCCFFCFSLLLSPFSLFPFPFSLYPYTLRRGNALLNSLLTGDVLFVPFSVLPAPFSILPIPYTLNPLIHLILHHNFPLYSTCFKTPMGFTYFRTTKICNNHCFHHQYSFILSAFKPSSLVRLKVGLQ